MYTVVNQSTGIVVARCTNRNDAQYWVDQNNVDERGDPLPLYKIVKERTKKQ